MSETTKITHRYSGDVLFESGGVSFREAIEKAVKNGVYLHDADLRGADLRDADLHCADLPQ